MNPQNSYNANPYMLYNPPYGAAPPLKNPTERLKQSQILDYAHPQINNFDKAQHNHETLQGGGTIRQQALVPIVKYAPMHISGGGAAGIANIQALADGVTNAVVEYGVVPQDYHDGDLIINIMFRPQVTGTIIARFFSFRMRDASPLLTIDNAVNIDQVFGSTDCRKFQRTIPAANFQPGDVIRIDIQRQGADGLDTLAGVVDVDMMYMEYTGYP